MTSAGIEDSFDDDFSLAEFKSHILNPVRMINRQCRDFNSQSSSDVHGERSEFLEFGMH